MITRKPTRNDILDRLYQKFDILTEQFRTLGKQNGWCDENGYLDPLARSVFGDATELEEKRLGNTQDLGLSIKLLGISIERMKLAKQIREMESYIKEDSREQT